MCSNGVRKGFQKGFRKVCEQVANGGSHGFRWVAEGHPKGFRMNIKGLPGTCSEGIRNACSVVAPDVVGFRAMHSRTHIQAQSSYIRQCFPTMGRGRVAPHVSGLWMFACGSRQSLDNAKRAAQFLILMHPFGNDEPHQENYSREATSASDVRTSTAILTTQIISGPAFARQPHLRAKYRWYATCTSAARSWARLRWCADGSHGPCAAAAC